MQIMSVFGSPRARGNTAKVLKWVEEQFGADGHTVERIDLADCTLAGCRECYACKTGQVPFCSIQDDANVLYEKLVAADLVILAAPLFCWNFPAQMKPFIDRMFCLSRSEEQDATISLVEGKPFAFVMTAGGPIEGNGDMLLKTYEGLLSYLNAKDVGQLAIPGCTVPSAMGDDIKGQAIEFAKKAVEGAAE